MSESHTGGFRLPVQKLADTLIFAVSRKAKMQASPPLSTNKKASFVKRQKAFFLHDVFRCAECDAHCVRDVSCGRDVRLRRVKGNTSQHCDRRELHHCAAGSTSLARKGKQHKKTGPPLSTNKKRRVSTRRFLHDVFRCAERDVHLRRVMCPADVMCAPRVKRNTSQHCDRRERHHCAAGSTSLARKGKQHKKTGPPLSTNKKASFVCRQKALFCMMYSAARNMMCTTCVMCPTDVMCAPRVKRNSSH